MSENKNTTLGILALFRNEATALEEFILHHLDQGVDHFYFIDNASNDDFMPIIDRYSDVITMMVQPVVANLGPYFDSKIKGGVQGPSYDMMLPNVKTEWLMTIDLDEFAYARNGYDSIKDFLIKEGDKFDQILIKLKMFNSNGHIKQPDSIIDGFTSRVDYDSFNHPLPKCIGRTSKIKRPTAHFFFMHDGAITVDDVCERPTKAFSGLDKKTQDIIDIRSSFTLCKEAGLVAPYLMCNHYPIQSKEWYFNIKATRGICGWAGSSHEETSKYFEEIWNKLESRVRKDDFELKELARRWKEK